MGLSLIITNKIVVFKNLVNFSKLLNKETSFIVVSGGSATPLELDKVKWSKKNKRLLAKEKL